MKYKIIFYFNSEYKNENSDIGNYSKSILKVFPEAKIFSGPNELVLLLDYIKNVLYPIIITQDYLGSDIPKTVPLISINYDFDSKNNNLIYLYGQKKLFEKRSPKNTWFLISDESIFDSLSNNFKNVNEYKIITVSNIDEDFNLQMRLLVKSFYITFHYSSLICNIEV